MEQQEMSSSIPSKYNQKLNEDTFCFIFVVINIAWSVNSMVFVCWYFIFYYIFFIFLDEPVPPGLHIRINLTSGKKEAKLLDKEETTITSLAVVDETEVPTHEELKQTDLEKRLKNIPADDITQTSEVSSL